MLSFYDDAFFIILDLNWHKRCIGFIMMRFFKHNHCSDSKMFFNSIYNLYLTHL